MQVAGYRLGNLCVDTSHCPCRTDSDLLRIILISFHISGLFAIFAAKYILLCGKI